MKTVLPALLLAVGFVPAPVISAPPAAPTAAQVDALLDAMDFEASQRAMLAQMDASMQELTTSMMGEDATAEDRARMAEIVEEQQAWMAEVMTSDRMLDIYRNALRATMTAAEIQAMTGFYRSPHGRSAMRKMPAMMAIAIREMQPILLEMSERSRKELEEGFSLERH